MRALSCVGLLAASSGGDGGGSLWLIDATGAYRVRALACGGGKVEGEQYMVAHLVNKKLQETDFDTMTAREGVAHMLRILTRDSHGTEDEPPLVPANSEMEVAITDSKKGKLERLRLSSLSQQHLES